jgi:hypothetical protein
MTTQNLSRSARSMPTERRVIAIWHVSVAPMMMMLIWRVKTNSIARRAYIHKDLVYWQCMRRTDEANINIDWRWLISLSSFFTDNFLLTIVLSSFLANEDIRCSHTDEWLFATNSSSHGKTSQRFVGQLEKIRWSSFGWTDALMVRLRMSRIPCY